MSACATEKKSAKARKPRPNRGKRFSADEKEAHEKKGRRILNRKPGLPLRDLAKRLGVSPGYAAGLQCWKSRHTPKSDAASKLIDLLKKQPQLESARPEVIADLKDAVAGKRPQIDKKKEARFRKRLVAMPGESTVDDDDALESYMLNTDEDEGVARRRKGHQTEKGDVENPEPVWYDQLDRVDDAEAEGLEIAAIEEEFECRVHDLHGDVREHLLARYIAEQDLDRRKTGHDELSKMPKRRSKCSRERD